MKMIKNSKRLTVRLLAVMLVCFCGLFFSEQTFARTATDMYTALVDKAIYQGVYNCYKGGGIRSTIDPLSNYADLSSLIANGNGGTVILPSGLNNTTWNSYDARYITTGIIGNDNPTCGQLVVGATGGTNKDLLTALGKTPPAQNDTKAVKEFMGNMGYDVNDKSSSSSKDCYSINYQTQTGSFLQSNVVCADKNDNSLSLQGSGSWDPNKAGTFYFSIKDNKSVCITIATPNQQVDWAQYYSTCEEYKGGYSGEWLVNLASKGFNSDSVRKQNIQTQLLNTISDSINTVDDLSKASASFHNNSPDEASLIAIQYLHGGRAGFKVDSIDSIKVTPIEKRLLYQKYLTDYYMVKVDCGVDANDTTSGKKIEHWLDTSSSTPVMRGPCVAYTDDKDVKNKTKSVNAIGNDGFYGGTIANLDDLLTQINSLEYEYSDEEIADADSIVDAGTEGDAVKKTCKNSGGAKALGWVICPILEWVSDAVDGVYNEYVEPNLQLSPQLFANQDGTSGTREAWETFRNFANIAFIILLLVVIFSQLTGVGIDNYGIKKILPKLIVAAILINLSYLICMVLVDLSNIVGSGIRSLFSSLGAGVDGMSFGIDGGSTAGDSNFTLESTAITGVGILAAIGTVGAIFANPAILLSLLVSAIGVFISIFFLFILLAAREAAIIVLVILSPLAFVCYMLPNTKKLFDKWWKFFEGLLLVYPIIGLLVGGGDYVSRLLMNTGFADPAQGGSFITAFTAMIVGIIPIFFIPMVLKGSFAAMGKVGGMLTGLGARARGAATGAMRRTEGFQNAQKVGLERRGRLAAQRRAGGRIGEDGQFHERGLRGRFARTGLGRALGVDVQMGRARNEYVKGQIDRNSALDSLNPEIANYQLQQAQNARTQSAAEARAGAMPLTPELAQQRATSRRSAQELKAFQDQFAGYSQAQLREEANNAGAWLGQENGSQRMSALLQSMEANGMENDMARMLSNNDISNRSEVLQTLASSKNAVFSAYGKRASRPSLDANGNPVDNNVSFNDFMTGTGNATNTNQSMQAYLAEKGDDAIAKLDDKSLGMIANAQNTLTNSGSTEQIMSTNQLVEAASRINSEDSLEHVNNMLANRNDIRMSGEQLSNMNATTLTSLYGNASAERAVIQASDAIRNDAKLLNTVKAPSMTVINRIRINNGHQGI